MSDLSKKSRVLGAKLTYQVFHVLKEAGGQLPLSRIYGQVAKRVAFSDYDLFKYKSGNLRWRAQLNLFSINCTKAGFLIKKKGTWILTKEGENAISLGEKGLILASFEGYKLWKLCKAHIKNILLKSS